MVLSSSGLEGRRPESLLGGQLAVKESGQSPQLVMVHGREFILRDLSREFPLNRDEEKTMRIGFNGHHGGDTRMQWRQMEIYPRESQLRRGWEHRIKG